MKKNYCGSWAWFHPEKGLSPFYCGSGNCANPKCKDLFWSARIRLISALIEEHDLKRFFTLTLDDKFIQGDPWAYIHRPWSKLRHRLKRLFQGEFKFVAILERHKHRDVPHIHGFCNKWLDVREWSRLWQECEGGKIVWVEKVKEGQTASEYVSKTIEVAKYVGKDQVVPQYVICDQNKKVKRLRTLWRSEKLKAKFELTTSEGWVIIKDAVFLNNELSYLGRELERGLYGSETK